MSEKSEVTINITQPERDMGLDCLRALALLLMVSIHYTRLIPDVSRPVEFLKFIGESAPAFFFFAFGMTMDKFFEKDHDRRLARLTSFLYISLLHNIFVARTFVTGFFFILWVMQALFYILHSVAAKPARWHFVILFATIIALFIIPYQQFSILFSFLIPGHFPILPWGLFVITGYLFVTYKDQLKRFPFLFPSLIICLATGCFFLSAHPGWNNLEIRKWPMSSSYFFLFCGANMILANLADKYKEKLMKMGFLYRPILFISKYLLLAVVVSYISAAPGRHMEIA